MCFHCIKFCEGLEKLLTTDLFLSSDMRELHGTVDASWALQSSWQDVDLKRAAASETLLSPCRVQLTWVVCVCVFVVWALILLLCLRHCLSNAYAATMGAYAAHTFEGVPTQGQRPCKVMPQHTCLPTPSHSRLLWKKGKGTFAYATTVPSTFLLTD